MIIQHNVMALNAHRQLGGNNSMVSKNLEKLSSGYRINRAGDDAAGLAVSEKMRAQITGLDRAKANAQDGISLVQTAEGALTEVHSMLNRMVELATQSANGTLDTVADGDRQKIQDEVDALTTEIDRISKATDFNGIKLLDGTLGGYNGADIAASAGVYGDNPMSVSGGALKHGDSITLDTAATGALVGGVNTLTVGGVTIAKADFAAKGIAIEVAGPDGNGAGTYSVKITVDKTKATAEVAEAIGEGLTVTMKMDGAPAGAGTVKFDVTEKTAGKGDVGGGLELQIGDTADAHNKVKVDVANMSSKGLGIDALDVTTPKGASAAIKTIKDAINTVSTNRSKLGALQNRLEHTINNLGVTSENMTAAESRIRDVDMAKEMMHFTKNNVLTQAAQAMLAQANQQPQQILQLLR